MSIDRTLYRQWDMLRMIPRHPGKISASEITARLADRGYTVNKRTIERDLKMFEELFGIVADDRSKPYGWQWGAKAPVFDIPALDDGQALLLIVAEPFVVRLLPPPVAEAFRPLLRAARAQLKEDFGAKALKYWPEKVMDVPPTQQLAPAPFSAEVHRAVSLALLRDQWLRIRYRKRGAIADAEHEIQPLGLVTRGPMTYVICRYRGHDEERTLAMSRIVHASPLDERFRRPEGFSLRRFADEGRMGFGDGSTAKIVLRFLRARGEHLLETPLSAEQVIREEGDEYLIVTATVALTPQLKWWVLGFGGEVEVVSPAGFRKEIAKTIGAMAKIYGG